MLYFLFYITFGAMVYAAIFRWRVDFATGLIWDDITQNEKDISDEERELANRIALKIVLFFVALIIISVWPVMIYKLYSAGQF